MSFSTERQNELRDHYPDQYKLIDSLPEDIRYRIGYGLYGNVNQYFIFDVDASLAQLGRGLPSIEELRNDIRDADLKHKKLLKKFEK